MGGGDISLTGTKTRRKFRRSPLEEDMLLRQAIRDTIERSVHAEDKDMFESLLSSMFPHSDADMDVVDYLPHLGPLRPQIELGRRLVEKYKASRIGSPDDVTAYSEPSDQ